MCVFGHFPLLLPVGRGTRRVVDLGLDVRGRGGISAVFGFRVAELLPSVWVYRVGSGLNRASIVRI